MRVGEARIWLYIAGRLLRIGVIGGVVVALAVFPVIMLAGVTAKHSSRAFLGMPGALAETEAGQTSYVYAADGKTLLTMFYEEYRRHLKLAEIPPRLYQAVVAAEDSRFYDHHGVDVKGLARAFVANQHAGGVEQGASTLTMQYVRMALRDGARTPGEVVEATERTPGRKLREARVAIELEKRLSKDDILERYLNVAYFGHQAFGVFAAAQTYFSKQPKDLSLAEAATWGSFTLGTADTSPLEMANAIATIAAEGVYCEPTPVISVERADGSPIEGLGKPQCHQAIPVAVARAATDAARCVTGYGAAGGDCGTWSTAQWVAGAVGRPVAGKSGTTDDTRTAWFVGYTPQLTAASFIADPDNPFHAVGAGNSPKPAQSVAGLLRDGLAGQPVADFTYP